MTHPPPAPIFFDARQDQGQAGDNLGALCRGLKRDDIRKGQVSLHPRAVWLVVLM